VILAYSATLDKMIFCTVVLVCSTEIDDKCFYKVALAKRKEDFLCCTVVLASSTAPAPGKA
jgi:hypothetical protein